MHDKISTFTGSPPKWINLALNTHPYSLMDSNVRKLLFEPLSFGNLSLIVPDFSISVGEHSIAVPARLTSAEGDRFEFTLHFTSENLPVPLQKRATGVLTIEDQLKIGGQIEGEIQFSAHVFPPSSFTNRSRGTSTTSVSVEKLNLPPDEEAPLDPEELRLLLGEYKKPTVTSARKFHAHVIFHGPKLHILDTGTETTEVNGFLGKVTSSLLDTHIFSGIGWRAALIQKGNELHLHVRSQNEDDTSSLDPSDIVDRICDAVAFTHGFQPWPAYREVRIDHRIMERWICAHLNLKQTFLAPVSKNLGSSLMRGSGEFTSKLANIIPTIADGLAKLSGEDREKLGTVLWNVRSSALGDLPASTKLLILCSAFDGLMKLVANDDLGTAKTWRSASDKLGLSWEWTQTIFELWGRHRHDLSHGKLWLLDSAPPKQFFSDYPLLGCAFMTVIAVWCGYEGPISFNPFDTTIKEIGEFKAKPSNSTPN